MNLICKIFPKIKLCTFNWELLPPNAFTGSNILAFIFILGDIQNNKDSFQQDI